MRTEDSHDTFLSRLVAMWPTLSDEARERISLLVEQFLSAASADSEDLGHPTRLSCTVDERSIARKGIQCEHGGGAGESGIDRTGTVRRTAGRGEAAPGGDGGEVRP